MNFLPTLILGLLTIFIACGQDKEFHPRTTKTGQTEEPCSLQLSLSAIFDCAGSKLSDAQVNSDSVAWVVLHSQNSQHQKYNGVARFGNCTGTLLDVGGSNSSPAYVLTNGHCISTPLLDPEGVFFDLEISSSKKMYLNYFQDLSSSHYTTVNSKVIRFASMDNTDVAIVELDATRGELISAGFHAYGLASQEPSPGQTISVVGVPQSGVQNLGLRWSHCTLGEKVALKEGDYSFAHSYRHRCSIVGGSSGSPVFDRSSGKIIGVVNTTANDSAQGESDCALNKPCEVQTDGSTKVEPTYNYAQSIAFIAACFSEGVFDKDQELCQADRYQD